ncbi:DUF5133 domain-containing protein [Streptomyces globisporus]|uniref:DUF5133 domain-containing protein n=1 Tax=Streptomyces globisporus TaxID=1908 RepID=A0A927BQ93_STRGL|nr:DUF5133 domain-containing protein [Streptomyces globisporus]
MLLAHPAVLEELLRRYDALTAEHGKGGDAAEAARRLEDVSYTLCVTTGTRDITSAVAAARERLRPGRPPAHRSPRPSPCPDVPDGRLRGPRLTGRCSRRPRAGRRR